MAHLKVNWFKVSLFCKTYFSFSNVFLLFLSAATEKARTFFEGFNGFIDTLFDSGNMVEF